MLTPLQVVLIVAIVFALLGLLWRWLDNREQRTRNPRKESKDGSD